MFEWLATRFGLLFEKSGYDLEDGVCPKCGDNLVIEMRFVFCCNPSCDYLEILKEEEIVYLNG